MKAAKGASAKEEAKVVPTAALGDSSHGLQHWLRQREAWLNMPPADDAAQGKVGTASAAPASSLSARSRGEVVAKSINVEDVIERIYSQGSNGSLREPIPLGQMIDLLTDFWEADGLYD